jgi:hypothetical protein
MNPTLDDFSAKSMSDHRGTGHLFELSRTAGVVLMCVSQEDVLDLGSGTVSTVVLSHSSALAEGADASENKRAVR